MVPAGLDVLHVSNILTRMALRPVVLSGGVLNGGAEIEPSSNSSTHSTQYALSARSACSACSARSARSAWRRRSTTGPTTG